MFRIRRSCPSPRATRLKLEGRLVLNCLPELDAEYRAALLDSVIVELDLVDVQYMDVDGLQAVLEMRRDGAVICGSSPFVDALLRSRQS